MPRRFLIAPDKFKGSLSAREAAEAMARGLREIEPEAEIDLCPTNLPALCRVDDSRRILLPEIIAACDVDNPLLGPQGASAIFAGQKGATPQDQILLETALAQLVAASGAHAAAETPGAGAAGGLGFGLLHFAAARLVSGFELLAGVLDLEKRLAGVHHVLTGEGALDHQSLSGKGPVALARLARSLGVPVTGFCGSADATARGSGIFRHIHALADTGLPLETLIAQAAPLLTESVAQADFS